jgi:predicted dehydrogenase
MVKIAIVGAGGYAFELIKRIWQIPENIELVAVSSNPSRKSAGRTACQGKGVPVYADVNELLENVKGKADLIFIPTPIQTHYAMAKLCLEKGFGVWLEKPPVATIQELDGLIELSKKYGKSIPVAFQSLYTTIIKEIKDRITAGEFGAVKRVTCMAGWPRLDSYYNRTDWAGKLKINGNWILDGTINNPLAHLLSNGLYFASAEPGKMAEPVAVQAELYHGHNIESEDTSSLRIMTDKGVPVVFNASLCSNTEMDATTVVECEKAVIKYKKFTEATITFRDGTKDKITDVSEQRIHMLKNLAKCYEAGGKYEVTLERCRPFTLAVNGAFKSCGRPNSIHKQYVEQFEQGDTIKTVIKGIDHVLEVAHANGKLFSEMGVEWAKPSKNFDLTNYKEFSMKI